MSITSRKNDNINPEVIMLSCESYSSIPRMRHMLFNLACEDHTAHYFDPPSGSILNRIKSVFKNFKYALNSKPGAYLYSSRIGTWIYFFFLKIFRPSFRLHYISYDSRSLLASFPLFKGILRIDEYFSYLLSDVSFSPSSLVVPYKRKKKVIYPWLNHAPIKNVCHNQLPLRVLIWAPFSNHLDYSLFIDIIAAASKSNCFHFFICGPIKTDSDIFNKFRAIAENSPICRTKFSHTTFDEAISFKCDLAICSYLSTIDFVRSIEVPNKSLFFSGLSIPFYVTGLVNAKKYGSIIPIRPSEALVLFSSQSPRIESVNERCNSYFSIYNRQSVKSYFFPNSKLT